MFNLRVVNMKQGASLAAPMDTYHVWVDLRPGIKDLDFAAAVKAFMEHLVATKRIEAWRLTRRKLGFGPQEIGEWHVEMQVTGLAQLDVAFDTMAARAPPEEALHAAVWSKVTGFRSALYRDFPDPVRKA